MNVVTDKKNQGFYMIPKASGSGLNYNDYFWYKASGQLWRFGGPSYDGSQCGLADAASSYAWSDSYAYISARLAFYGTIKEVSKTFLAESK